LFGGDEEMRDALFNLRKLFVRLVRISSDFLCLIVARDRNPDIIVYGKREPHVPEPISKIVIVPMRTNCADRSPERTWYHQCSLWRYRAQWRRIVEKNAKERRTIA